MLFTAKVRGIGRWDRDRLARFFISKYGTLFTLRSVSTKCKKLIQELDFQCSINPAVNLSALACLLCPRRSHHRRVGVLITSSIGCEALLHQVVGNEERVCRA